jgi:Helix-turn-helix domain
MSGKATGRVWELQLSPAERMVLLALADHADHLGANIYPSIALVAWKTGYSGRQVSRVIAQLVTDGLLIVLQAGGGRKRSTMYRFDLDAGTVKPPFVYPENHDKMSPIIGNHDKMAGFTDNHDKMSPFPAQETMTSEAVNHDISGVNHDTAMSYKGTLKELKGVNVKQQQQLKDFDQETKSTIEQDRARIAAVTAQYRKGGKHE